jgi:HD-GYP domain-containing protein (c-di-GMP phosphodiesterase class II)
MMTVSMKNNGNSRRAKGGNPRRDRRSWLLRRIDDLSLRPPLQRLTAAAGARVAAVALQLMGCLLVIYLAGGVSKFNPQIFWLPILMATFWFGPLAGAVVGLAAGLLVGPYVPLDVASGRDQALADWLPRIFYFVAVALMVGTAHTRLRGRNEELVKANERLKAAHRRVLAAKGETRHREQVLREATALQERFAAEVRALQVIDAAVLNGSGEQELMELTTRLFGQLTQAKTCAVVVPTAESGNLQLAAAYGSGGGELQRTADLVSHLEAGESVAAWAINHCQPIASENVFRGSEILTTRPNGTAAMAAPVMGNGQCIGALMACFAEDGPSGERLEQTARFANQLSVCIQNVQHRTLFKGLALDTVFAMAEAIESRDPYTGDHCRHLADYADLLAGVLDLSELDKETIRCGAALHDVGKIGVSDAVLKKPGKLTPPEWAEIRLHPYIGGQLCKRVGFLNHAYPIVYHHHERFDGQGYPDGLRREDIPLGARIVSIADAFDAMTTQRPYRAAMSQAQAIRELRRGAGRQWDPQLVDAFLEAIHSELPTSNGRRHREEARRSRRTAQVPGAPR